MSSRKWDTDAERERKREQRLKQRLAEKDRGKPWEGLVGEEREQAIRDHFGYSRTETRTQAERDEAARKMMGRSGVPDVEVPEDIEAVWGGGRLDSTHRPAIDTAKVLIDAWGVDRFRRSQLHKMALEEHRRSEVKVEERADYRKRDLAAFKDKT